MELLIHFVIKITSDGTGDVLRYSDSEGSPHDRQDDKI